MKKLTKLMIKVFLSFLSLAIFVSFFSWKGIREKLPFLYRFDVLSNFRTNSIVQKSSFFSETESLVTMRPVVREVRDIFEVSAVLEPEKEISVTSKLSGRVNKLYVKEGDYVKKGQILLRIEDELFRSEVLRQTSLLEIAESQVSVALEKLKIAESKIEVKLREIDKWSETIQLLDLEYQTSVVNYEKKKELWKMGSVSLSELERWELESKQKKTNLDNAKRDRDSLLSGLRLAPSNELSFEEKLKIWKKSNTELEKAEVNLAFTQKKIAEENLQNAKRILNDTEIRSPESGKISKINIETGELIHNQSISLIDIFYGKNIFVVFAISDMDLDKVSKGQSILFNLAGRQDTQIAGSIRFISPFLDQKTHSILVKSILDSKNENLLPGMYGIVSTELKSSTEKLFVPLNLVRGNEESGYFVYLKEGTRKRKQYVRLKIREEEAEIVSGINPNDEIVLLNSESFN